LRGQSAKVTASQLRAQLFAPAVDRRARNDQLELVQNIPVGAPHFELAAGKTNLVGTYQRGPKSTDESRIPGNGAD